MGKIISAKDVILEGLDKTLYEIILDQSSDPIFCFAPDGVYLYINHAFSKAFNLMPSDIIGKKIWDVFPGKEGDMRFAAVKKAFETKAEVVLDVKVDALEGTRYYMTSVTPIMDGLDIPRVVICISKEITLRKNMEQALEKSNEEAELKNIKLDLAVKELYIRSITDGLTQLYNRQHSIEMVQKAIDKYNRRRYELSLIIIDIDYFKLINDTYGHTTGDQALIEFTAMMKQDFEFIGHVGRYGGEEFIISIANVEFQEILDRLDNFRIKVATALFTSESIHFTFSAGLKIYEGEGVDAFINRIDALMYQAKHEGRNKVCI